MMNADLAEVSKKHTAMGHPLRNRSASSHSGEGTKADPNRYMKYLSLRNRKIVESKVRNLEEQSSNTNSTPNLEHIQDQQMRPLQPILKSTSSRVQDLRFRDGSLHKTSSTDSMPPIHSQRSLEKATHPGNHSPLRVKSPHQLSTHESRSPPKSGGRSIEVYKTQPEFPATDEVPNSDQALQYPQQIHLLGGAGGDPKTSQQFQSMEQQSSGSRKRRFDRFDATQCKSTTELANTEAEFHFDFDQDDECSYVNTTMQSEYQTSPKNAQSKLQSASRVGSTSKKSISAYQDELKTKVDHMSASGVDDVSEEEPGQDESSGYVIDYEQVLKDNSHSSLKMSPSVAEDNDEHPTYKEDIGTNTILEQTQEAIESEEDSRQEQTPVSSCRQQDSPQFKEEQAETESLLNRRGSRESPVILSRGDHSSRDRGGAGHKRSRNNEDSIVFVAQKVSEPIMTFENRQQQQLASLSNGESSDRQQIFEYNVKSQIGSNETTTFRAKNFGLKNQFTDQEIFNYQKSYRSDDEEAQQHRLIDEEENQQTCSSNRDHYLQSETQPNKNSNNFAAAKETWTTPSQSRYPQQLSDHDMAASAEKRAIRREGIDRQYEKLTKGGSPPESSLMVSCIIRQPMDSVGLTSKFNSLKATGGPSKLLNSAERGDQAMQGLTSARTSHSFVAAGSTGGRKGNSISVGPIPNRNPINRSSNGLDLSRSSSLSGKKSARRFSCDSRSNLSAGGGKAQQRRQSKNLGGAMGSIPNAYKHPHILTTQIPSKFVLRSPPGLQASLYNTLLRSEQDITHCQLAFDEHGVQNAAKSLKTMKVIEFDSCVGETKGHSLSMGLEHHVRWITQPNPFSSQTKNVIFLFGQSDALKHQLLNVMQTNSLINQCLKVKEIRFIRVSMYHFGQEYLLAHKSFGNRQQMRREIGMELREAFRERDLNSKKIALKLSTYSKTYKAEEVKNSSHLIIQLDDLVFVDLAAIDNLKESSIAKKISADFSVVTNSILSMSPFYKDHNFVGVEEDRLAPYSEVNNFRSGSLSFKSQINKLVSKGSKVLLLCCVIQCSVAGTQAVDYCHKIRTYYQGNVLGEDVRTHKTPTRRMQQANGDVSMETDQNVNAFKQLGGLISEVQKARMFIDKIFANKARGEPLKRSRVQLKDMVSCLRDDVSDLLNSLAANNENYIVQLKKIREMLQAEIFYMRDKVNALRSVTRRGSASSHNSRHQLCILPKTMLNQHQANQSQGRKKSLQRNKQPPAMANLVFPSIEQQHSGVNLRRESSASQTDAGSRPQSSRHSNSKQRQQYQLWQKRPASRTSSQTKTIGTKIKSLSQSRKTTESKVQVTSTPNLTVSKHQQDGLVRETWSNSRQRQSHESLKNGSSNRRQSTSALSQKSFQRKSSAGKVSRNSISRHISSNTAGQRSIPNCKNQNMDLVQVESAREHRIPQVIDQPANSNSAYCTQQIAFEGEDFRKHTLNSLNQQYLMSGTKSLTAAVPDSSGTKLEQVEKLHQEMFELREQLKAAIDFSEEQSNKRKAAEQNCIKLTKELSQNEIRCHDMEDRIIAKDQTIRSLESQVEFLKSKLAAPQVRSIDHEQQQTTQMSNNFDELEALKRQKAETDHVNQDILGQISMLKDSIQTFQEQDHKNQRVMARQKSKEREMEELKLQVQQLMQSRDQHQASTLEIMQMREELTALQAAKEKYREEALGLKQEVRQSRQQQNLGKSVSKERQRTTSSNGRRKESQDREPLHIHSRLQNIGSNNMSKHPTTTSMQNQHQQLQQDQQATPQHMPQQKSLNTIKSMIKDFKEQRKGLMRTTSSREAQSMLGSSAALSNNHAHQSKNAYKRPQSKSRSRSREKDDKRGGYSQLNSHFR